jgi:branched-chain amino acid aminotransferase
MIPNDTLVSINGELTEAYKAHISVFDRGLLFGDSVYEATLVKNKKALFWKEHLDRLHLSAQMIGLPITVSEETLQLWTKSILQNINTNASHLLRLVVTRGSGAVNLAPSKDIMNTVIFYATPLHYPEHWYKVGLRYAVSERKRNHPQALDPKAKTGNYLNSQLALMDGKALGFDDAVLLNQEGFVTEGSTNNIWIVKDNALITPHLKHGLLKGITRDKILELAKIKGWSCREADISLDDLYSAQESFMTSSTKGVVPIVSYNNKNVGSGVPGALTLSVREAYESLVSKSLEG